jgi:hypothetical protein
MHLSIIMVYQQWSHFENEKTVLICLSPMKLIRPHEIPIYLIALVPLPWLFHAWFRPHAWSRPHAWFRPHACRLLLIGPRGVETTAEVTYSMKKFRIVLDQTLATRGISTILQSIESSLHDHYFHTFFRNGRLGNLSYEDPPWQYCLRTAS